MSKGTVPVVAIVLVVAGLVGTAATMAFLQPFGSSGWSMRGNMDAMFIEQMIPHHDDAIAMAELALARAEHPEIRQLAEDVKRTQSAEIVQMREWYREWFDADVPDFGGSFGMMGGGMMGGPVDMEDLAAAVQFDKAFIEAMVPHHQMGIMMSQMAGSATSRTELRDLTESIIEGQSAEIAKMQDWYDEWYGR
jgi:uncharacterized protein (DUF305 family)